MKPWAMASRQRVRLFFRGTWCVFRHGRSDSSPLPVVPDQTLKAFAFLGSWRDFLTS